jgi:hypothetical protein
MIEFKEVKGDGNEDKKGEKIIRKAFGWRINNEYKM